MKVCIGIISYFPETELAVTRKAKLEKLISQCDSLFGIPIVIIAQNQGKYIPKSKSKLVIYKHQNGLGITGARRELRTRFLNSDFDYLIMLDDDSSLIGTKRDAEVYLSQIAAHPNMFGVHKRLLLKLFAISKEVYKLVDFPEGEPAAGDYFEDMWLTMYLEKKHKDKMFTFTQGLREESNSNDSVTSTQYYNQIDKKQMGDKTRGMISQC